LTGAKMGLFAKSKFRCEDVRCWPILLQKSAGSTLPGLGSGNSSSQSLAVCPAWVAATPER
jgi:hypothetical protein